MLDDAPGATPAYVSTEIRLRSHEDLLHNAHELASFAARNSHLTQLASLSAEVASMVAGPQAVPAKELSIKQLQDLFYHRAFQFTRGNMAQPSIDNAPQKTQRQQKQDICKVDNRPGSLSNLMISHFRTLARPQDFYSVATAFMAKLKLQEVGTAVRSSLGKASGPSALPIQDRLTGTQVAQALCGLADSSSSTCQIVMECDSDEFVNAPHLQPESVSHASRPRFHFTPEDRPALEWPFGEELTVFRVSHAAPARLKRPTGLLDDVRPDDVALRLYSVVSASNGTLQVQPSNSVDVYCSQLFQLGEAEGSDVAKAFTKWETSNKSSITWRRSD